MSVTVKIKRSSFLKLLIVFAILVISILISAVFYYHFGEFTRNGVPYKLSILDSVYFSGAAATAAGYVDIYPFSAPTKFVVTIQNAIQVLALLAFAYVIVDWQKRDAGLLKDAARTAEEKVSQLQAKESAESDSLVDFICRQVNISFEREKKEMFEAKYRAKVLFHIGSWFLGSSILGPVISVIVYLDLGSASGEGDWRILLAGVSFGFLLLAAAHKLVLKRR